MTNTDLFWAHLSSKAAVERNCQMKNKTKSTDNIFRVKRQKRRFSSIMGDADFLPP